jgi:hypothetical protein
MAASIEQSATSFKLTLGPLLAADTNNFPSSEIEYTFS